MTAKGGIFLRKNILAICDEEQDYASHFLDYLSRNGGRESFPFEVRVFTERESWEHFLKQNSVSVLLVSQPLYERCLQTTFSFTLGQLLARKNKVLYLNFECFSGLGKMLRQEFQSDLSDLIYFLHNGDGRFPYRLEGMTQKVNGLDYIPPAFSCLDLQRVEKEEWMALLDELGQSGLYDYVILDLSEVVNGLFDILKRCFRVYTIVREDGFAAAKQAHYEELLTCLNHEDILENTRKCRLPLFRQLPQDLENLTRGELAELVQKLIAEDLKE